MQEIVEIGRYNHSLRRNAVVEVLPEYFVTDYPNLVAFLESYYDNLDSDETISYLDELFGLRDIERATVTQLDLIFEEIASGASREYFRDPREVLRNFAQFYRVKGTRFAAEGFFRSFFSENVEIEFPKNNLFILNEPNSEIGTESLRYIQNGALYQIFSVLLKTSIPIDQWRELYKVFVHPAGFYLGGEVVIEQATGKLLDQNMPISVPDSDAGTIIFTLPSTLPITAFSQYVGIIPDTNDSGYGQEYISLNSTVRKYQNMLVSAMSDNYNTINGVIEINSPTFDALTSSIVGISEAYGAVDMSNSVETMDADLWFRDSGSDIYMTSGYVDSGYVT
jgi:hypothetical protein